MLLALGWVLALLERQIVIPKSVLNYLARQLVGLEIVLFCLFEPGRSL